jgi:tripartite ATP-independent transporter DctP family solute receptor
MSSLNPFESPIHSACLGFKAAVEKLTAGKYQVNIYPAGTLGKELDLMEAVKTNQIQVNLATPGGLYRVFPPAYLCSTPFIFRNEAVGMATVDGPFTQKIVDAFTAETGIKALGFIDLGTFGCYTNNIRPIKKPADMKGIKFRAMDQLQITAFKALGASAVPIAWPETYTSLQTGVVQGQSNPTYIIMQAKFAEVQKYLTITRSSYSPLLFVCSKKWYESLSAKEQQAMRHAALYGRAASRGMGLVLEGIALEKLKKDGMQIEILSPEEVQEFRNLALPKCLEMLRTQMNPKWVDGLLDAVKEAEAKLGY